MVSSFDSSRRIVSLDVWGTLIHADPQQKVYRTKLIAPSLGWTGDPLVLTKAFSAAAKELDDLTNHSGIQYGTRDRVQHVCASLGLPKLNDAKFADFMELLRISQLKYLPRLAESDLPTTLRRWRKEFGLELAIICNTGTAAGTVLSTALEILGVMEHIAYPLWSDEVGVAKPNRAIFDRVVEVSGVPAKYCLHVGDNLLTDYQGGHNAGFNVLQYTPEEAKTTATTFVRHSNLHTHPLFQKFC